MSFVCSISSPILHINIPRLKRLVIITLKKDFTDQEIFEINWDVK